MVIDFPEVSVIIPILNGAKDIEACLEALRSQDYPETKLEIIMVDNGSKDGSLELLVNSNVRFLLCPARGRANALNLGLLHARGEIICTTDISCRPSPSWISTIVKVFEDPRVGCVAGEILQHDDIKNSTTAFQVRIGYMSALSAESRRRLPYLPYADGANASFRRSVFEKIGPFEACFFKAADVEICYRMLMMSEYSIAFCKEAVVTEAAEPSLGDLLKQRYRIGQGQRLLAMRFPKLYAPRDDTSSFLKQLIWRTRETFKSFSKNKLADAARLTLMRQMQAIGRRRGKSVVPQGLVPIPEELELRFLENHDKLAQRVFRSEYVSDLIRNENRQSMYTKV